MTEIIKLQLAIDELKEYLNTEQYKRYEQAKQRLRELENTLLYLQKGE